MTLQFDDVTVKTIHKRSGFTIRMKIIDDDDDDDDRGASTHPRNLGNHVIVRFTDRPSAPQVNQCSISKLSS